MRSYCLPRWSLPNCSLNQSKIFYSLIVSFTLSEFLLSLYTSVFFHFLSVCILKTFQIIKSTWQHDLQCPHLILPDFTDYIRILYPMLYRLCASLYSYPDVINSLLSSFRSRSAFPCYTVRSIWAVVRASIKVTSCHRFYIGIRLLCLKVIPCKKTIQRVEVFFLRNKIVQPNLLDLLKRIYLK